jgi:STAS-like domain of unknown function (DUF4325)
MPQASTYNVERDGNVLTFPSLTSPSVVGNFIRALYQGRERGYSEFTLDFHAVEGVFPNVCAPIAGIIEYYHVENGISFDFQNIPEFLNHTKMLSPLIYSLDQPSRTSALNTVWKFATAFEIKSLVDAYLYEVSRVAVCQPGVIQGLEWCLNEIMDNVLLHAATTHGYVMGQVHLSSQHIAICIYDHGQGMLNSLRHTQHGPRNALDAITIALKEGVTRDKQVYQGNGMWGLHNIVRDNSGLLNITSGSGFFGMRGDDVKSWNNVPFLSRTNNCTTVDFQIDFDKPVSIAHALGEHQPVNIRIENLQDDHNNIIYKLAEKASGTGTRQSGLAIRNEIINLSNQSDCVIALDFSNVSVVSSSFADELVGKLVSEFGFVAFMQRFRLVAMNETVQAITNRSVFQRLAVGQATPS